MLNGRTSTSKTDEDIKEVESERKVVNNRKLTIRELRENLKIAYGTVKDYVVNVLGLCRVAEKLVPKDLKFRLKGNRVDIAKDMFAKVESAQHSLNS